MSIEGQGHFFTIYFPGLYVLCFTRPRYQVSVYRTIGPLVLLYHKVPKFSDTKIFCCKLPKIQTKQSNLRLFCQNGAKGIENSEDLHQTAPLGLAV